MITKLSLLALLLIGAGCRSITGCDKKTQTVEIVPGDPFFNSSVGQLDLLLKSGWTCDRVAIRNSAGVAIGDRYTCTKC